MNTPEQEIDELMARAWAYDDKPHLLYSYIESLAAKYENGDDAETIHKLMQKRIEDIQVQKKVFELLPQLLKTLNATMSSMDANEVKIPFVPCGILALELKTKTLKMEELLSGKCALCGKPLNVLYLCSSEDCERSREIK